MKIALVMPLAHQRGGAEELLLRFLAASGRHGDLITYEVAFLEAGPMVEQVRSLGVPARVFPSGRLRDFSGFRRSVGALAKWLASVEFAGAVAWMPKAQIYLAAAMALNLATNSSVWLQHGLPTRDSRLDRIATALPAIEVWCCSQVVADAQRRISPRRACRVLYPCVDLRLFDPSQLLTPQESRRRLGLRGDVPVIALVARLQRWKGCDLFVAAAGIVKHQYEGRVQFLLVGGEHFSERGYVDELRGRAAELGLGDHLRFLGHRTDVPEVMQAADIIVNASAFEPFGMSVLEGMALAKAVVIRKGSGGPEEVTRAGVDVCTFDNGAAGLAAVLIRLLADQERRSALGRAGRVRALAFGSDAYAARFARMCAAAFSHSDRGSQQNS